MPKPHKLKRRTPSQTLGQAIDTIATLARAVEETAEWRLDYERLRAMLGREPVIGRYVSSEFEAQVRMNTLLLGFVRKIADGSEGMSPTVDAQRLLRELFP